MTKDNHQDGPKEADWNLLQREDLLEELVNKPDEEIDTSDIPEILDWSGAVRGKYYKRKDLEEDQKE